MAYYFENILGTFIVDDKLKLINESKGKKNLSPVPKSQLPSVLQLFKDKQYFSQYYQKNLQLTRQLLKESVSDDQLIVQAIANINELDRVTNILVKRLREWYSLYNPEWEHQIDSHEQFVESVLSNTKKKPGSMGADLKKVHLDEINHLGKEIKGLFALRKKHEDYLQQVMSGYCPNLLELAGTTTGARLIELAKGLKRLALLPSSTIQLLGAEKALFRHLKSGSRSPKYGVIFQHPFIQKAKRENRGKAARMLADKLSLCSRLDYFKGEFKAKEYQKELEERLR
ncbi:MAG TPA: hypothetical protein VJG49_00990 [Candidatus Nanoarchaeia archaeon]|nr:hypothetical protein [Candidatus Nanoarchaeia archaeon]